MSFSSAVYTPNNNAKRRGLRPAKTSATLFRLISFSRYISSSPSPDIRSVVIVLLKYVLIQRIVLNERFAEEPKDQQNQQTIFYSRIEIGVSQDSDAVRFFSSQCPPCFLSVDFNMKLLPRNNNDYVLLKCVKELIINIVNECLQISGQKILGLVSVGASKKARVQLSN